MGKIDELIKQFCPNGVEVVELGKIAKLVRGKVISKKYVLDNNGEYPVYSSQTSNNGEFGRINTYMFDGDYVTWTTDGAYAGTVFRRTGKFNITNICGLIKLEVSSINVGFLYYWLAITAKKYVNRAIDNPKLMSNVVATIKVPLPPLAVQKKIVEILDTFTGMIDNLQKELEQRQKQFEYYRSKFFAYNEDECDWFSLPMISENCDRKRKPIKGSKREKGIYPYYGASGIVDYVKDYILDGEYLLISEDGANLVARNTPIAFSIEGKNWVNNHAHVVKFNSLNDQRFVEYYFNSIDLTPWISGGAQPKLNQENLNKILIPYPSVERRNIIVDTLKSFEALISNIKQEIELRQKQYEYYREKLLTFE